MSWKSILSVYFSLDGRTYYQLNDDSSLCFLAGLPWSYQDWDLWYLVTSLWGWKSRLPTFFLAYVGVFSFGWFWNGFVWFCSVWYLAEVEWLLYECFLSWQAAPFLVFWIEKFICWSFFLVCTLWHFQFADFFSCMTGIYKTKTKSKVLLIMLFFVSEVSIWSAFFLFYL